MPNKYLFADTLIVDTKNISNHGSSTGFNIDVSLTGRLKSNLKLTRTIYEGPLNSDDTRHKFSKLHFMFDCKGCIHEAKDIYIDECECLPVLRSNIHNEIYANNPNTLDEEGSSIILEIIMETYLFWIVPLLFLYWKITQFIYHYLDKKINEKKL